MQRDVEPVEANDERRPLTIVFSDLVRSTGLSASVDDEDFMAIIGRYYAIAEEVFTSHGGYIAQRLGDGVFVWFGYPVAREDDADRAVAAGIELIERIRGEGDRLERTFGAHIDARVGIHSGSVVVRALPDGDVTAFGFTVNFAAKVEEAAPIGAVVLSEATLERLLRLLRSNLPATLQSTVPKARSASSMCLARCRRTRSRRSPPPVRSWGATASARGCSRLGRTPRRAVRQSYSPGRRGLERRASRSR
jgi:class 3 adenylate cyclase